MTPAKVDRCLSTDELAERFDIPAETLKRHRKLGDGPPWFRFGKHVRYPEKAAAAWVESQLVHPA